MSSGPTRMSRFPLAHPVHGADHLSQLPSSRGQPCPWIVKNCENIEPWSPIDISYFRGNEMDECEVDLCVCIPICTIICSWWLWKTSSIAPVTPAVECIRRISLFLGLSYHTATEPAGRVHVKSRGVTLYQSGTSLLNAGALLRPMLFWCINARSWSISLSHGFLQERHGKTTNKLQSNLATAFFPFASPFSLRKLQLPFQQYTATERDAFLCMRWSSRWEMLEMWPLGGAPTRWQLIEMEACAVPLLV